MPSTTRSASWRDSWPPTQLRLQNSIEKPDNNDTNPDDTNMSDPTDEDISLPLIDDSPLHYFLTPAPPLLQDPDSDSSDMDLDLDFAFDAGIEDRNHPSEIVRSVSPSSLPDGVAAPARPPTPPRGLSGLMDPDFGAPTGMDEEDDEDEYIRFGTGRLHALDVPFSLRDFAALKAKRVARGKAAQEMLAPSSAAVGLSGTARRPGVVRFSSIPGAVRPVVGRPSRGRTRSLISLPAAARRGVTHVWREPSPDVWSIEEETEEELEKDKEGKIGGADVDGKAAKPKKRVRFVLPATEV